MSGIEQWVADRLSAGTEVTLATLVRVEGSAPLAAGAMLAVGTDGELTGSVAGGCVDSTLVDLAADGVTGLHRFAAEDGPWAVGPVCGGRLTVWLERLGPADHAHWATIAAAVGAGRTVTRRVSLTDPSTAELLDHRIDPFGVSTRSAAVLDETQQVQWVWPTPPRLIIAGADAIAVELARSATGLGWRVTVIDPRPTFTRPDRWRDVAAVSTGWPQHHLAELTRTEGVDAATAICVLTHDDRVELPSLLAALASPAGFVGALGSLPTDTRRRDRLLDAGADPARVAALHGPLGLALGGRDPASIALSIVAELQSWRYGGSGLPLSER